MPAPIAGNPLTDAHYREINKALNGLANGYRMIQMAEEAGHDMTDYRTSYDIVRKRLEDTKRVFFPERP